MLYNSLNPVFGEVFEMNLQMDTKIFEYLKNKRAVFEIRHYIIESEKQKYADVEIVSKGSSLKFCLVAEGKADVYPRFAPTMEWDTAAGQAICSAAGLKVISRETNKELAYNKENLLNPHFMVSS